MTTQPRMYPIEGVLFTLKSKGRITLTREYREAIDVEEDDVIEVIYDDPDKELKYVPAGHGCERDIVSLDRDGRFTVKEQIRDAMDLDTGSKVRVSIRPIRRSALTGMFSQNASVPTNANRFDDAEDTPA